MTEAHSTPYHQLFGNLELVTVRCAQSTCMYTSQHYERNYVLQLPIQSLTCNTVDALLKAYCAEEELDAFYGCPHPACGALGCGRKTIRILQWPPILVVSLKRFAWHTAGRRHEQLDRHSGFNFTLQPQARVTYQLCAIIVHSGGAFSGHYTAYTCSNGEWFHHDDSLPPRRVEDNNSVLQLQAYMSDALKQFEVLRLTYRP